MWKCSQRNQTAEIKKSEKSSRCAGSDLSAGQAGGAPSSVKQPIMPLLEAKVLLWEASDMQYASMSYQNVLLASR